MLTSRFFCITVLADKHIGKGDRLARPQPERHMKKHANRQAKSQLPLLVVRFKIEVIWLLHAPPDRSNSQSRESRHLVSHSHWWCRLHYRSCQGGQETIICMGGGVGGTSKKTIIKCIRLKIYLSSIKKCMQTHWQVLKCIICA